MIPSLVINMVSSYVICQQKHFCISIQIFLTKITLLNIQLRRIELNSGHILFVFANSKNI